MLFASFTCSHLIPFNNFFYRFLKHTLKPQDKSTTAKKLTERKDPPMEEVSLEETPKPKGVNPILCNEKLMTAKTPGESCMRYLCYTEHSTLYFGEFA